MKTTLCALLLSLASAASAEVKTVFLEDIDGARINIATLNLAADGSYALSMNDSAFSDFFLSMRPFKCLAGAGKHWCHVPYPYDIARDVSSDLTDLEYDFLFVWKDANEYGINMWNGVYYKLEDTGAGLEGRLHEMDMDVLSAPPAAGELRPLSAKHLHESDPESHWLPKLVIE